MSDTSSKNLDMRQLSVCVCVQPGELGRVLRRQRKARRLTVEDLAGEAGVHPTYLSAIERGERNPTWRKLSDLALALGMPLSSLAREAEREARVMRIAESVERSLAEGDGM